MEGLKNLTSTFYMIADGFYFFTAFLGRKENIKFLLASLDSLSNSKNPSGNINPLQRACCGIPKAAYEPITVPKAACDSENVPQAVLFTITMFTV